MKSLKIVSSLLVAAIVCSTAVPYAAADKGQANSLTITIDRRVKPQSYFHIGRFFAPRDKREATLTVYEPVIRNLDGMPIDSLSMQTASGRTEVPLDSIRSMQLSNWVERRRDDIPQVEHTVKANILFINGSEKQAVISADFGTIEGKTDRGEFFLNDPQTVRYIEFHR